MNKATIGKIKLVKIVSEGTCMGGDGLDMLLISLGVRKLSF